MASKVLIIALISGVILAYISHIQVPEGCDFPLPLRLFLPMMELLMTAGRVNVMLGGSFSAIFNYIDSTAADFKNSSEIEVWTENIAGVETTFIRPVNYGKNRPGSAMIFFHGGGFMFGSIRVYAPQMSEVAKKTGMLLISPEYRLAPKHPFPAAFEDSLAVTKVILNQAQKYKIDPKKIVLSGDSSGGNLAAAVSLAIGREKTPNPICMINLMYPVLQVLNFRLPSHLQNSVSPVLNSEFLKQIVVNYMGLGSHPELGPLFMKNLHMAGFVRQDILKRLDAKWVPHKFKRRRSQERFELIPEEAYEVFEKNKKKIQGIASDVRLSVLAANDTLLKLLPKAHTITCEFDPLRDEGVLLNERLVRLGMDSTISNLDFCAHGAFNFYGMDIHQNMDKAIDEMLKFVMKSVENC